MSRLKDALEEEILIRDDVRRLLYLATRESSQRAVARQLGISQSAIAQRLSGYQSDYDHTPLETMASLAGEISDATASGTATLSTMLRLIAQAVSDFRSLTHPHDQRHFLREPPRTGDQRWDALLAGVAAREARRAGVPIPRWTTRSERFLDRAWFPSPTPGLRAMAFAASPADLAIRNVYLDPAEWESI